MVSWLSLFMRYYESRDSTIPDLKVMPLQKEPRADATCNKLLLDYPDPFYTALISEAKKTVKSFSDVGKDRSIIRSNNKHDELCKVVLLKQKRQFTFTKKNGLLRMDTSVHIINSLHH